MIVRIENGVPVEADVVSALEGFTETKFIKSRRELFLHECPLCHDTDNRKDGTQGAISYSLEKNCVSCAKCGQSEGWVKVLAGINVEWSTANTGPSLKSIAEMMRRSADEAKEEAYVDHGDWKVPVDEAIKEHLERFLSLDGKVKPWLEARGFAFSDLYGEDIGSVWCGESKAGWLVIVYRDVAGGVRGFKYRNIVEKDFWAQKGVQEEPYGIHRITSSRSTLIIVEGELDAEALVQYGVENVISVPNGSNSWRDEWCAYASHAELVLIATDNDKEGELLAKSILESVPKNMTTVKRIARVYFTNGVGVRVKDANQAMQEGASKDQIRTALLNAEDPDLTSIHLADQNVHASFIPTRWDNINYILGGGCLTGEVIHLAGKGKSGKTTIALDIHHNLAGTGVKSGFLPLDMNTSKIVTRFGMSLLGKTDSTFYATVPGSAERNGYIIEMRLAMEKFYGGKLIICNEKRISTYAEAMGAIERMGRGGCKLITVEDYLSLASMYDSESKGKNLFAGRKIIRDLTYIAERCESHIILINHLKDNGDEEAYGASQIGAGAQASIYVTPVMGLDGRKKSVMLTFKNNRMSDMLNVSVELSLGLDRILIAGPITVQTEKKNHGKKLGGSGEKPNRPTSGDGHPF